MSSLFYVHIHYYLKNFNDLYLRDICYQIIIHKFQEEVIEAILQYTKIQTIKQLCLPIAHRLTFLSSPPVASTWLDLWPIAKQLTFALWAMNSSATDMVPYWYSHIQNNHFTTCLAY